MHQHGHARVRLARELAWLIVLLLAGLFGLPVAVFHVGTRLFGPYEGGTGGLGSFLLEIFESLASGEPGAWLLVLSPLICIGLIRFAVSIWRRPGSSRPATPETNADEL